MIRIQIRQPKIETARYASPLMDMNAVEQANKLCDRGLVWNMQIYRCEPFFRITAAMLQMLKIWSYREMVQGNG